VNAWHLLYPVMSTEFASLVFRPVSPADENFRFTVYASTRVEEVSQWGWTSDQQALFLKRQFTARERAYPITFPGVERLLVCHEEKPIGVLAVHRTREEIRLVDVALLPEHRGGGVGRRIVEKLQAEAQESSRPLRLQVLRASRAGNLYARLGFQPISADGVYQEMEWRAEKPPSSAQPS
jgi:GNAT superfamily N-acetyltransferase